MKLIEINRNILYFWLPPFLLIVIDQTIKAFVLDYFFQIASFNKGVSFGLFPSDLWLAVNVLIVLFLIKFLKKSMGKSLILAGGVSNIIDRVIRGVVVDYIDLGLFIGDLRFPSFNMADVFICIGAGLLLFKVFKER